MKRNPWSAALLAAGFSLSLASVSTAAVVTFEGLLGGPETYWRGSPAGSGFTSNGAHFSNSYMDDPYLYWEGFAYSNTTDRTTAGHTNDYSAYATSNGGAGGSSSYGVVFLGYSALPTVTYSAALDMAGQGASITNTTYAYLSMTDGDEFAKKFGGASGNDEDWFKLTITGYLAGAEGATIDFYLADFRFADNGQDYIINDWTYLDFTDLGVVDELRFSLSSSDNDPTYGMNTPAYFAIDNLATVPEPSAMAFAFVAVGLLGRRKRRA